jgi:hypothetical protein
MLYPIPIRGGGGEVQRTLSSSTDDHGLCFQQAGCSGGGVGSLPTQSQCQAVGGKSWLGGTQQYRTSF